MSSPKSLHASESRLGISRSYDKITSLTTRLRMERELSPHMYCIDLLRDYVGKMAFDNLDVGISN